MIDSYKNFERLRYRINKDIKLLIDKLEKNNEEQRNVYVDECFSAIASSIAAFFFTQSTFGTFRNVINEIWIKVIKRNISWTASTIITSVLCLIILILVSNRINAILHWAKRKRQNKGPEGKDNINYVKEFDNIACDSLIVSLEYKQMFLQAKEKNEKTLYYLEILHYVETACEIMEKLCKDSSNIRSTSNVFGVYTYRIHNAKKIMHDLKRFMEKEISGIKLAADDKAEIESQLKNLSKIMDKINI